MCWPPAHSSSAIQFIFDFIDLLRKGLGRPANAPRPSISSIPFHCRLIDSIKSKIFFHQLPLVVPFIDSIPFSWFIPQSLSLCVCLPFRGANGASAHNRASKPTSKGEIAFIHTALALLPSQLSILFQFH